MNQILLIDDEAVVRKMLTKGLTQEGYDILIAEDGEEGLRSFQEHDPAVVILDIKMPKMDGIAFLQKLPPETFQTHVFIVLTGHGGDTETAQCYKMGVMSFLRKPVNLFELKGIIHRSLEALKSQLRIHQMNRRMQALLNNMPDLVWECDANLNLNYVSENVTEILGFSPDEWIGRPLVNFVVEEDVTEFFYKFNQGLGKLNSQVRGLTLKFKTAAGQIVPMQMSVNAMFDAQEQVIGMVGINRDLGTLTEVNKNVETLSQENMIRVNADLKLIYLDESVQPFFFEGKSTDEMLDFCPFFTDPSLVPLFKFAFDQCEDVPFPVEVKLSDTEGDERWFTIHLQYRPEGPYLEGCLVPTDANDQAELMSKKIEAQEEALQCAVVVDEEMKQGILVDSQNLTMEILDLIKSLQPFTTELEPVFSLVEYEHAIRNRNIFQYGECLRLLGNKVHGLKGSSGFLIQEAKQLCHRMEEITRPLADFQLVLTEPLAFLLKQFVFKIQDLLEQHQTAPNAPLEIGAFVQRIDQALADGKAYLGDQADAFTTLLHQRSQDRGEIRKRKDEDYLSVSCQGYEELSHQVKKLFHMISENLREDRLIQAGNLYNEFLDTHQQIKKVCSSFSRYERLIPNLAEQYGKAAELVVKDPGVKADREFWNAVHEMLNHCLKNAVIHGLESVIDREALGKEKIGRVQLELAEDALHTFISVSDDGRGLDVKKIKEKALEQHLVTPETVERMSEEEIYHLVFEQGISTAEQLDDNAGRGVGMNAVLEAMHDFQGTCRIQSTPDQGTTWNFTFPKNNVSLPCFIVKIGDFRTAIPEDCVEAFHGFQSHQITQVHQKPAYRLNDEVIPLAEPQQCFDSETHVDDQKMQRILILKSRDHKLGLAINDILHHATLPIVPLPEDYRNLPVYLGATLFGNDPVLVLNVHQMV